MLIYKITNLINNKIYIGKTTRSLDVRWKEHIQDSKNGKTPLYLAIQKYGIENFKIEIIQDDIFDIEELNRLEQYYIQQYDSLSHNNGYNIALGGDGGRTTSKLSESDIKKIIGILSDENNLLSYEEIGKQFNIDKSVIQNINVGKSWFQPDINYPIRKYNTTGLTIPKNLYKNIIDDILNSSLSLKEISKKFNLSENQLTAINQGYFCYNNNNLYYKGIYNGIYPIRKNKNIAENEILEQAIRDIIFTNLSMEKIGSKYGIKGNTLTYIQRGLRRKELTKDFLVPLRQFQKENQEIYLQKKGGSSLCTMQE